MDGAKEVTGGQREAGGNLLLGKEPGGSSQSKEVEANVKGFGKQRAAFSAGLRKPKSLARRIICTAVLGSLNGRPQVLLSARYLVPTELPY